jgi:hypothetical protein
MTIAFRSIVGNAGLFVGLLLTGCSNSDRASVSGVVRLGGGAPPAGTRVIAQPSDGGKAVYGTTDDQGAFTLTAGGEVERILPGEYQVAVMENLGRGDMDQRAMRTIPNKYAQPSTSGLAFSVKAGEGKVVELLLDSL